LTRDKSLRPMTNRDTRERPLKAEITGSNPVCATNLKYG